jgi:Asp-tRNA(Asn)/Glu-tRNA(Gln) amidotransferase A subunit family amidase
MSEPLYLLDATESVRLIKTGEIKVLDLVQSCLERIDQIEPVVEAWAYFDPDVTLSKARELDIKLARGDDVGDLFGVLVGIKDIFNTVDMPTQMGSPLWKGFSPGNDARVVHYLRMADAIIPGKTVTAEFAVHTPGPTRNPHNPEYMAGTSSTGSAVAVAANMVPLSIGTQTAGSTIRPASYTGIFGYKPSFGLLPRTAMLKTTDSLDTVGMFSRSVRDLRLLFDIMRVKGVDYPINEMMLSDASRQTREGVWKVGVVRGPKWEYAESYAQDNLLLFSEKLNGAKDIEVEEIPLFENIKRVHDLHSILYDRTLAYYFKEEFQQETLVSDAMYAIIEHGNEISLEQYISALEEQANIAREFDDFLVENNIDILLDLSTGGEALKGLDSIDRPDHCLIWTFCGIPAISLPVFIGPHNLPYGVQVVSRKFNDYLLLSFAEKLSHLGLIPDATYPPIDGQTR